MTRLAIVAKTAQGTFRTSGRTFGDELSARAARYDLRAEFSAPGALQIVAAAAARRYPLAPARWR